MVGLGNRREDATHRLTSCSLDLGDIGTPVGEHPADGWACSPVLLRTVQSRRLSLDTTSTGLIKEFADLMVNSVGYREVDATGHIDSVLNQAALRAAER